MDNDSEEIWHVLVVTEGGTVTLLKNLTEQVARETIRRLAPIWMRPDCPGNYSWHGSPANITKLEAFGPKDKTLDVWPEFTKAREGQGGVFTP